MYTVQHIEGPFMLAVKDTLGDRFTISVEETYRTIIHFILTQMSNEIENYQSQNDDKLPVLTTNVKPAFVTPTTEVMLLYPFMFIFVCQHNY